MLNKKETDMMKIQQRIWRNQLRIIHIKWKPENAYYEAKIKEALYPLEEKMLQLGLLRNISKPVKKKKKKAVSMPVTQDLPFDN